MRRFVLLVLFCLLVAAAGTPGQEDSEPGQAPPPEPKPEPPVTSSVVGQEQPAAPQTAPALEEIPVVVEPLPTTLLAVKVSDTCASARPVMSARLPVVRTVPVASGKV